MVKDHSDSERGNPLLRRGLLIPIVILVFVLFSQRCVCGGFEGVWGYCFQLLLLLFLFLLLLFLLFFLCFVLFVVVVICVFVFVLLFVLCGFLLFFIKRDCTSKNISQKI